MYLTFVSQCMRVIIQAVQEDDAATVDHWISYLKESPNDEHGNKIIDKVDHEDPHNNALHNAIIKNNTALLEKLIDADAGINASCVQQIYGGKCHIANQSDG